MAQSQNTVREVFVATALAAETTLATFDATASDGEIGVFNADGTDGDTQGKFVVAAKINGKTVTSDVYADDQVKYADSLAGAPEVQKQITVTPTELTAGTEYIVAIRTFNYGSLSVENFYEKYGQYVVQTGDAATDIVDGLIASLNKSFSKEPGASASSNPYYSFVNNAGTLEITAKEQTLELGKDEGRRLEFEVFLEDGDLGTIAQTQAPSPGVATGKQTALAEYFYRGNRGDAFRKQHFPYNWDVKTKTTADPNAQHSVIEMTFIRKQDEEFQVATSRKHLSIFVPDGAATDEYTVINAIKAKLEVVAGVTMPTTLTNSI